MGDAANLGEIYAKAYKANFTKTRAFLRSRGVPKGNDEEFAQAAWARGWQYLHSLDNCEMLSSWVCRIAWNLWLMECRKTPKFDADFDLLQVADVKNFESVVRVTIFLSKIESPVYRKLLKLRLQGYTSPEIGQLMQMTDTNVRLRMLRYKKKYFKNKDFYL